MAEYGALALFTVAERNIFKINAAVRDSIVGAFRITERRLLIQHTGNSLGAGKRHREHDDDKGKHHQTHQNLHTVGEHCSQLACGQLTSDNHHCAEPADRNNAAVYGEHHQRRDSNHEVFRLDKKSVEVIRRPVEFTDLMLLTDKRFDNTDRGNILLYTGIEIIIAFKNLAEILVGANGDKRHHGSKKNNRNQIDTCKLCIDQHRHRHSGYQIDRRAETNTQ